MRNLKKEHMTQSQIDRLSYLADMKKVVHSAKNNHLTPKARDIARNSLLFTSASMLVFFISGIGFSLIPFLFCAVYWCCAHIIRVLDLSVAPASHLDALDKLLEKYDPSDKESYVALQLAAKDRAVSLFDLPELDYFLRAEEKLIHSMIESKDLKFIDRKF